MLVRIVEIPESAMDSERELSREDLEEILSGDMPTRFAVRDKAVIHTRLSRAGLDVVVGVQGSLALSTDCSTCLNRFDLDVPLVFNTTLQPKPASLGKLPEDLELNEADVGQVFYKGDAIDLGELLREQIILSLPMFPRCAENCLGLCPGCGHNLNQELCTCESRVVDPRFAALKDIKAR